MPQSLSKASLRANVLPFLALDVLTAATHRESLGESIIHLEIGEPCAPPPRLVREAAIAALSGGPIGYTQALGRPSLRAKIAGHYQKTYGVTVAPERIVVTTGSSGGFMLALLASFDHGGRVAVSSPGYPAYRTLLDALGLKTVTLETGVETGYIVTPEMIEAAHAVEPLDGLLLMSPSNPTGVMMTSAQISAICAVCDKLGITFLSDEVYHGLTYGAAAETAVKFSARVIAVNSFSKFFCMTGWRIGWLVLPETLVRPVELLQQSFSISVPTLSQIGAEAAFDCEEELAAALAGYARNRAMLLEELPHLGLPDFQPLDGAFYAYVNIGHKTEDAFEFCKQMLDQTGVAATPGLDFDRRRGHTAMRLSYAGKEANLREALKRMRAWLA